MYNSMPCGSLAAWTLGADELELQRIIPLIFSLNRWFISAYANGLTAKLNMSMVFPIGKTTELNLKEPISSKACSIKSVAQKIPKMALTVTTIKVTRFRTFNKPCVQRDAIG